MRLQHLLFLFILLGGNKLQAQEQWNAAIPKDVVILQSTRDYNAALKTARQAAARLGKKLDLADNHPNKQLGLSMTKTDCEGNGYDYPCYNARGEGNADNSDYISVEYSNAYEGFAKGYYIVVAAVTEPGSAQSGTAVAAAQKWYKGAYAKRTRIWRGCMH